ncbi:hypothetical protein KSAC_31470 (plasmid) [Komagataeibacter saccharivorans]|uniref:hypothetical protein n=1 Tax=Komagataeibacter saccharivorans TaxID=265959 RepID=UPI00104492B7|nr:hypothetical protein [Komagataeibacter saccharivorans]QBL95326.1 hypothetical protein KSAC_31470 [Komagataeibacter saccharivorans]
MQTLPRGAAGFGFPMAGGSSPVARCDAHLQISIRLHSFGENVPHRGTGGADRRGTQIAALCLLLASDAFDGFSAVDQLGTAVIPFVHAPFLPMTWPLLVVVVLVSLVAGLWAGRELRDIRASMPVVGRLRHFLRFGMFSGAALGCLMAHFLC